MLIYALIVGSAVLLHSEEAIGNDLTQMNVIDPALVKEIPVSPSLQKMIDDTVNAFVAITEDGRGLENAMRHLTKLKKSAGKPSQLVPQLVYYSANMNDMAKGMTSYMIYEWGEISPEAVALGLAPYVWEPNKNVRQEVHQRLHRIDGFSPGRQPYFRHYGAVVGYHNSWKSEQLALPIIVYMYQLDPGEAVLTMSRVLIRDNLQEIRQIILAEHIVADMIWRHTNKFLPISDIPQEAIYQLNMLSQNTQWWVRLYVAEIMRQHTAFRQSEIIERLKKDDHPLVRKTIEEFTESADKAAGEAKKQNEEQ